MFFRCEWLHRLSVTCRIIICTTDNNVYGVISFRKDWSSFRICVVSSRYVTYNTSQLGSVFVLSTLVLLKNSLSCLAYVGDGVWYFPYRMNRFLVSLFRVVYSPVLLYFNSALRGTGLGQRSWLAIDLYNIASKSAHVGSEYNAQSGYYECWRSQPALTFTSCKCRPWK